MSSSCQIVADIGGTNARFACIQADSKVLHDIRILQTADFTGIDAAIRHYLATLPPLPVDTICLALACPVAQDEIRLTNNPWHFSRRGLEKALNLRVAVINDFTAQAICLDELQAEEFDWLGSQRPLGGRMRVIMGPGTGLGVAGISPTGDIIATEGGHISFAPLDARQVALLEVLWQKFPRVSVERLLSGPGLATLYHANSTLAGAPATLQPQAITAGAQQGEPLCLQTVQDFLDILASVAGDIALASGALDGIYLAGGILPKLGSLLDRERFRRQFSAKGRMSGYCGNVPLALLRAEHMGLRGCAGALRKGLA